MAKRRGTRRPKSDQGEGTDLPLRRKKITQAYLKHRAQDMAEDRTISPAIRLNALKFMAEMVPGALAPTEFKGTFNLEQFVEAAGGRPLEGKVIPLQEITDGKGDQGTG